MGSEDVPDVVRQFLDGNINSVEELETLLLLYSHPEAKWTAAEISRQLYTSEDAARKRLAHLSARELAKKVAEQSYAYSPSSAHAAKIVEELSVLYKIRRVTIITLIYSKPSEQIRDFSDAFRFKKDEEDGNG